MTQNAAPSIKQVDSLIHARWIIPVNAHRDILENHSLAIKDDRIIDILPTAEAKNHYQATQVHELNRHALIPGFINAHGHAAMSLFRGLADDLPLMDWLNHHIWPAEGRWVSEAFVLDGTRLAIAEMIRCGTTTYSDNYFYPEASATAATQAGMRVQIVFPILDFPTAWGKGADDYIEKGLAAHDKFQNQSLVRVGFGPHAPYTVSDEPLQKIALLAEQLDVPVQMHIHESADEVNQAMEKDGRRPIRRLADLGFLSPRLQCVHMTQMNEADYQLIAQNGCHVVHCPESNLKLASGFMPLDRMQQEGINVALGTDGCASNNDLDMLGEMRTAALLAKAVGKKATALNAHEALASATINGARAMGIEGQVGSLENGKLADIAAFSLDELENYPLYHPVSQLVYTATRHQATHVWVNGRLLMDDRRLTTLDDAYLISNACQWQKKIAESAQGTEA